MDETLKLDELAKAAGVSVRTVRYYVQRGLLPGPVFRGKDTAYGPEHLVRLRAIRRLQDRHLPLDVIQAELARRDLAELEAIADGRDLVAPPPAPPPSAAPRAQIEEPAPDVEASPRTWRRYELVPGVEVHVADDARIDGRALDEAWRWFLTRR